MINDRLIWIKQICLEVEALRRGAGVSYAEGNDPLTQLYEEWKHGSYTEGQDYPPYEALLLEKLRYLSLRYEGYAYTSQVLEEAADTIEALRAKVEELTYRPESVLMRMAEQLAARTAERDAAKSFAIMYSEEVAKAQAREAQLREALEYIKLYRLWINSHCKAVVEKALALPQDDTALKQYGVKLLRDAAENIGYPMSAIELRRMADELEGKK